MLSPLRLKDPKPKKNISEKTLIFMVQMKIDQDLGPHSLLFEERCVWMFSR